MQWNARLPCIISKQFIKMNGIYCGVDERECELEQSIGRLRNKWFQDINLDLNLQNWKNIDTHAEKH